MRRNLFVSNPYVIYSLLWMLVILLYKLEWSDLYPYLSYELIFFLVFTIVISLLLGYFTWRKRIFEIRYINNISHYYPKLKRVQKGIFILMLLDIFYSGYVPLFVFLNGPASGSTYLDFGIPFVHIIVVNGFSLLFNCSFWLYRNCTNFKEKKKFLLLCGLCTLQPILFYSRAQLMLMLLGALYIILITNKNVTKTLIRLSIAATLILYLFGLAGDFRQSGGGENYFVKLAGANDNFYRTKIPSAFFWGYIYISSPLANVQSMIDTRKYVNPHKEGVGNLIYNNMTPGIIKTRLGMDDAYKSLTEDTSHLIIEELNVGGIYYGAYGSYKWLGMAIIFFYYITIVGITMKLIPRNSIMRIPTIVVLILITFMQIFSNPFANDGFMPQLIIAIFAARFSKSKVFYYKDGKNSNLISNL